MRKFEKFELINFLESLDSESSENKEFVLCEKDKEKLILQANFFGGALSCGVFKQDEFEEVESLDFNTIVAKNSFQLKNEVVSYVADFVKEFLED